MSIIFNADEIFEIAEQIERNGAAFYRKAAEQNPGSCEFLLELADQEDEHLAFFAKIRKELSDNEKEETAFDPNGEASLYLKALADGKIFDFKSEPAAKLKSSTSVEEIIKIAIALEKDSIIFYIVLKDIVPAKLGADKITHIIAEEMKHIRWLCDRLP